MAEAVYPSEGFIEHIVQQCYENVDLRVGATAFTARQSVQKTTNILMQRSHVQQHTATICDASADKNPKASIVWRNTTGFF